MICPSTLNKIFKAKEKTNIKRYFLIKPFSFNLPPLIFLEESKCLSLTRTMKGPNELKQTKLELSFDPSVTNDAVYSNCI